MFRLIVAALAAAALLLRPRLAVAETHELDLARALSLARARAPSLAAARARIAEARGRLAGASLPLRDNPVVEGLIGRGLSSGAAPVVEVTAWQPIELGKRSARIESAQAGLERERASMEVVRQRLLRDVATAYFRALRASERARIAERARALAASTLEVAERRRQAGEAGTLDVAVARAALGRASADLPAMAADRALSIGELELLLGLRESDRVVLKGSLAESVPELGVPGLRRRRPELRMLQAERDEAAAEVDLGRGSRWPEIALGVRYSQEDRQHALLGGLSIGLPIFERGQAAAHGAIARRDRAAIELSGAERAAALELRTAREVYRRRLHALTEIERRVLPYVDEGERLARRSYEAGETALGELLVLRRELLDARRAHVEALFEVAVAAIEVRARAGTLR